MIKRPPQTVLYYPNMTLPSNDWLRHSLLYWDGIRAIVPEEFGDLSFSNEMRLLRDEGQFFPIDLKYIYVNGEEFKNDVLDIIVSERFNRLILPKETRQLTSRVHATKANPDLLEIFVEEGLAAPEANSDWYNCEPMTAFIYMSMLADHFAQKQTEVTVPSTDMEACQSLIFEAIYPDKTEACLAAVLSHVLPVPRQDTPLKKIIEFKRKREDELLQFQTEVDALHMALQKEGLTKQEAAHLVTAFARKATLSLSNLNGVLRDADITTVTGSFKALIQASVPALWTVGIAAAVDDIMTHSPMQAAITGVAAGASLGTIVTVMDFLANKRVERNKERRSAPMSYLLSAQASGIL